MPETWSNPPELIVMTDPRAQVRARSTGLDALASVDVSPLASLLGSARLKPLFGPSEDHVLADLAGLPAGAQPSEMAAYYGVDAPPDQMRALAESLRADPLVTAVYLKPPAEPPLLQTMTPAPAAPPVVTPDFTPRQGYLGPAPAGVDAFHAHTRPGGRGKGVKIIDVEGGWDFPHEDLLARAGGVVGGFATANPGWFNHGTAVIGEFSADVNGKGVTGICPDAFVRAVSIFTNAAGTQANSASAIHTAAKALGPGDILLIELHRPGPRFNFQSPNGQRGYIPVEWWPDDMAAIRYAIARGVIVVEAGGNGGEDLDDPIYNTPPPGFPASWRNPFPRNPVDSGVILVGAGNPPKGTHGRTAEPGWNETYVDRARCGFSNYGAAVDVQGWGWQVTTTGYGDLQGGGASQVWYTDTFSGTSSASPIVVGVLGCVQGNRRATGLPLLTPAAARQLLRSTGSPQKSAPGRPASQRIGNRPNLRQLIP